MKDDTSDIQQMRQKEKLAVEEGEDIAWNKKDNEANRNKSNSHQRWEKRVQAKVKNGGK